MLDTVNKKRIVFYTESEWAFGIIHYELTKYLFAHGVNSIVLPWSRHYTQQEMCELSDNIDYFVSSPWGVAILIDRFGIPPEKCIAIGHALLDLEKLSTFLQENITRLHAYSVVSEWLVEQSRLLGLPRVPNLTPLGINYNSFYSEPSDRLRTVGYAGAVVTIHEKIKRYWLVEQATTRAGLELKSAQLYHNSFVTMQGFYKSIDAVLVASTEEGAGLPALEASAAGKLVISTPVGLWLTNSGNSGHTVPIEETAFMKETVDLLNFYKEHPDEYRKKCLDTQAHAQKYDWSNVINLWVEIMQ